MQRIWLRSLLITLFIAILAVVAGAAYVWENTPEVIKHPKADHYHFRLSLVVDGTAVNFADAKFQEEEPHQICSSNLTEEAIHFHDEKDQIVHIHWKGMTGQLLLKNYGWNVLGGLPRFLGVEMVNGRPKLIPIHGHDLPGSSPSLDRFWVYTGDEQGYKQRDIHDFLTQDFETFLGKRSTFEQDNRAVKDESSEARLERINNFLGNVVMFVQKDKPTDQQIKDRFNHLVPLEDSACAG